MKILIAISDSFCANFIRGQGNFLVKNGHEVVIVSGPGEEIDLLEKNEPVKVIRIPFNRDISIFSDIVNLIKIVKTLKKEKPDLINAGNPKTGFLFSIAHKIYGKQPLIFTLRGIRSDTLIGLKRKIILFTEYITCKFANLVIAISPSLKQHAIQVGIVENSKCVVIGKGSSNGVDLNYYTLTDDIYRSSDLLLNQYNIPTSSFKIIYVGRITRDKGLIELLEAFQLCLKKNADIRLIIAGPIEKQDSLPNKYYKLIYEHPRIHYLGKQIDVRPVYALGDVLVLYSHREGFGNVAIEASSMKLPTIVADIPGLRDTTINNVTGLTVEPRNAMELSKAIFSLYENKEFALKLGVQGRERVEKYFSNEIIWSKQLEVYNSICASL